MRFVSKLRSYQAECIDVTIKYLQEGVKRHLVSLPVGSGKTVILSHLLPRIPIPPNMPQATKSLVIAHREELIMQAFNQIRKYSPHLVIVRNVTIDQGSKHADVSSADVIVASINSLIRNKGERLRKYDPAQFKGIIIDEAHHSSGKVVAQVLHIAESYMTMLNYFGVLNANNHILLWGCSATPMRHDGISLGKIYEKIIFHVPIQNMIEKSWLCDVLANSLVTKVSLQNVSLSNDDFDVSALSKAVNLPSRNEMIVHQWKQLRDIHSMYHPERNLNITSEICSTLVFGVDTQHVRDLADAFRSENISVASVTGTTRTTERKLIVEKFYRGEIDVLVNCGIFTEGTDIPRIDCLVMARPTKSDGLYMQMLGRGMRLHSGKTRCVVLDVFDRVSRMDLMSTPQLLGMDSDFAASFECSKAKATAAKTEQNPLFQSLADVVLLAQKDYKNLFSVTSKESGSYKVQNLNTICRQSPLSWYIIDENLILGTGQKYIRVRLSNPDLSCVESVYEFQRTSHNYWSRKLIPITFSNLRDVIKSIETLTKLQGAYKQCLKIAPWRSSPVTEAQVAYLRRLGFNRLEKSFGVNREIVSKGDAHFMISVLLYNRHMK